MKKLFILFAGAAAVASTALAGIAKEGDKLTIDGEIMSIAKEDDFGEDIVNIVLKGGGGISVTETIKPAAKTYSLAGTGIVSVASGKTFQADSKDRMVMGTLGQTLVKRGPGTLHFNGGPGKVTDDLPTRWVVEEGILYEASSDFFGNHSSTTTNLT